MAPSSRFPAFAQSAQALKRTRAGGSRAVRFRPSLSAIPSGWLRVRDFRPSRRALRRSSGREPVARERSAFAPHSPPSLRDGSEFAISGLRAERSGAQADASRWLASGPLSPLTLRHSSRDGSEFAISGSAQRAGRLHGRTPMVRARPRLMLMPHSSPSLQPWFRVRDVWDGTARWRRFARASRRGLGAVVDAGWIDEPAARAS